MDRYEWIEKITKDGIRICEEAIPKNLAKNDFYRATLNCGFIANTHTTLGVLHWRHGLDPRPDFENAIGAYERVRTMAKEYSQPKWIAPFPSVYAMLFLMGRKTPIEFEDEDYHDEHRWPCYECCLVHALHDQPLNEHHARLLDRYLAENNELADRSFITYFQLLGLRPGGQTTDQLVQLADANWKKRKGDRFFSDGVGYGKNNDLYVDIYLSAVLKKIGWNGDSVHKWHGSA